MAKKDLIYKSIDALKPVETLLHSVSDAIDDPTHFVLETPLPELAGGIGGGAAGGIIAGGLIYGLGHVGLGAAGITSGLKALGFGISMMTGVGVAGALVAVPAVGGYALFSHAKTKKLDQEKERLYHEAIAKQNALIKTMQNKQALTEERASQLEGMNILLTQAIQNLQQDLAVA